MSYDIDIADESFNYTFNVSGLFYDHIPDYGKGGGLRELSEVTGKQAVEILSHAFERIAETKRNFWQTGVRGDPEFCAKYDAENGWGSTVGALIFLAQIMAACAKHPRHKVRVSL